jgi:hypothetical protein
VEMISRKVLLIQFALVITISFVVQFGFAQIQKEGIIFFSGKITRISRDYKVLVVNEMNILINSDTKLVDEKGKGVKMSDLKPEVYVRVEGVQNRDGFLAKKIIVKKVLAL